MSDGSSLDLLAASQDAATAAAAAAAREDQSEDLLLANSASLIGNGTAEASQEEEEEEVTPAEVVERMTTAWVNEKFAPALLPHRTQIVDCLLDQIKQMESSLREVGRSDFRVALHRQELARVRFLVAAYLRLRLRKIERFIHTLDADEAGLLSEEERRFAASYKSTLEGHFKTLALQHMPGTFAAMPANRGTDPPLPAPSAAGAAMVFAAVPAGGAAVRGVAVTDRSGAGDEGEVDLEPGSQHILRYQDVEQLVKDGSVKLI